MAAGLLACAGTPELRALTERFSPGSQTKLPELHDAEPGLPAPQALRASSGQLREIPLRWDPLLDESVGGYVLERAPERQGPFELLAGLAGRNATVYVDRGPGSWPGASNRGPETLSDGQTFFYRVRAFERDGALGPRSEAVAARTAPPPDPPAELRAWSHRPRLVPLGWEPATDVHAAGYVLERGPTPDGPFERIANIQDRWQTSWVDEGLGDLRVFFYRISTVNGAGGRGEPTQPVRAVTKPEPLPPLGLRVVARRLGENELGWDPNVEQDLKGYRLLRIRAAASAAEPVAELRRKATVAVDAEVDPGERLSYVVVARDRHGLESAPSGRVEVESEGYELSATLREDGVHLQWNPRVDEGYERARILLETWLGSRELAHVTGSTWVHTDVESGTRYRYRVVLERPDGSAARPSRLLEISVPNSWTSWLPGQDSNLRPSG